jgi:NAD(P)-dependent dehydrogenase (short-subunit alcohol dehydrogenase family)
MDPQPQRGGIRVNAVVPGASATKRMWANVAPEDIPVLREQISREVPLGRLAEPRAVAQAVTGSSRMRRPTTGSHLVCDGGILAKASISV